MRAETLHPVPARRAGLPREVDDRELYALLGRSARPIVLESYHQGWERPWRSLSAEDWRNLATESFLEDQGEGIHLAAVETGKNRATAVRFGLEVIPTVLIFLGGEVVARFTGRVLAQDVVAAIRAARQRSWTLEASALELEASNAAHEPFSSPRPSSRRRTAPLARVG